jgi:putative acetyltransferase
MHIRRPSTTEHSLLADLWRRVWASANPHVADVAPAAHWLARVESEFTPPNETLVIDHKGRPVAFIVINRASAYVAQLFVDVDFQGQGVGRRLLDEACNLMPEGWHLHVATANTGARRFYEHCGLVRGELDHNPVTGRERVEYRWQGS